MKKVKKFKSKLLLGSTIAGSMAVILLGTIFFNKPIDVVSAEEVFAITDNRVTATMDYGVNVDLGVNETRKGVLLSASATGAKVDLTGEQCGKFEMDFRVVSDSSFVASGDVSGDSINNPALELEELKISFTELSTNKAFDVIINGGSCMNFATPQASVAFDGQRRGVFIYNHSSGLRADSANTTQANEANRYTALYGTSFSNTAYTNDVTPADFVSATTIGFDPYTMEVYYLDDAGNKTLIWDMSATVIDGQAASTFDSFQQYSVSLEFSKIKFGTTADLVVYSLNGQELSGATYANSVGPNVFASYALNAVKNKKVALNAPYTYDVLGNKTESISVTANINGKALTVYDKNGMPTDSYVQGGYIIPDDIGDLEIVYQANDGGFNGVPFVARLTVFAVEPQVWFALNGNLQSGVYGVGQEIVLSEVTATSELFVAQPKVLVSVYKNGTIVSGFDKIEPNGKFVFDSVGDYEVVYTSEGVEQNLRLEMTVENNQPAFNFAFELPKQAYENDSLILPEAIVIHNGESKKANVSVEYPDGGIYTSSALDLKTPGEYSVTYAVEFGGITYKKVESVTVLGKQASFTNPQGTVTLGVSNNRYSAMTGVQLNANTTSSKFTYTKMLDLSMATADDVILKMYSAGKWGEGNGLPTIYLTDAHDSSNVVTIHTKYGWHEYLNCGYAYAPDQTEKSLVGTEVWTPADGWGTNFFYNGQAMISPLIPYKDQAIDLRYDAATKCLYQGTTMIIDLDADYQEIPWKGFTTGEVYLSITGVANALVTEVFGNDFSVGSFYTDREAPTVSVNTHGWAEDALPEATVGTRYEIFEANAVDNWSSSVTVDVRVYYDYGTDNRTELNVKDGAFVPKKTGRYTIEYMAKDAFGNCGVKTLSVYAVSASEVEEIEFTLANEPSKVAFVGAPYEIPAIATQKGGASELDFIVEITEPDGKILLVEKEFVFTKLGVHCLTYTAIDYSNNQASKSYMITVTASDEPIFANVTLPKVILSGTKLKLPICEAIDYSGDVKGEVLETQVKAKLGGQDVSIENGVVVPVISSSESNLEIVYTAKGASRAFNVKVVNPGNEEGFMANYLYDEEGAFTKVATKNGITFTTMQSNAQLQFINPVLANNFMIKMTLPDENKLHTDRVTFWLSDSEDENINVRLDIIRKEGDTKNSYLSINGGAYRTISGSLYNTNLPIGFIYKQDSTVLMNLNGNAVGYLNDDPNFKGFTSQKIIVKIGVGEVSGEVALNLVNLNNQVFSRSDSDSIIPEMVLSQNIPTLLSGKRLTVPSVIAQDVLASNVTVKVTVLKIGGETLYTSDVNETTTLTISEAGRYRINYVISDGGFIPARLSYTIQTVEDVPPMMQFDSKLKTEYKVGDKLQLPKMTITDDTTEEPTVRIYMYFPNGSMWCLEDAENMKFAQVGSYKIKFFVYDEFYNYVEESFAITVR